MISEVLCRGMSGQGLKGIMQEQAEEQATNIIAPATTPSQDPLSALADRLIALVNKLDAEMSAQAAPSSTSAQCPPCAPCAPSKPDEILVINDTAGKLCSAFISNVKFTFLDSNEADIASLDSPLIFYDKILDITEVTKDTTKILKRILSMRQLTQDQSKIIDDIITKMPSNMYADIVKVGLNKYKEFFAKIDELTTEDNLKRVGADASRLLRSTDKEKSRIGLMNLYGDALKIAKDVHTIFTDAVADPFNSHIIYDSWGQSGVLKGQKAARQQAAKVEFGNMDTPTFQNEKGNINRLIESLPDIIKSLPTELVDDDTKLEQFADIFPTSSFIKDINEINNKVKAFDLIELPTQQQINDISAEIAAFNIISNKEFLVNTKELVTKALTTFNDKTIVKLNEYDNKRKIAYQHSLPILKAQLSAENAVLDDSVANARSLIAAATDKYNKLLQNIGDYERILDDITIQKLMSTVSTKETSATNKLRGLKGLIDPKVNRFITAWDASFNVANADFNSIVYDPSAAAVYADLSSAFYEFKTANTDFKAAVTVYKSSTLTDIDNNYRNILTIHGTINGDKLAALVTRFNTALATYRAAAPTVASATTIAALQAQAASLKNMKYNQEKKDYIFAFLRSMYTDISSSIANIDTKILAIVDNAINGVIPNGDISNNDINETILKNIGLYAVDNLIASITGIGVIYDRQKQPFNDYKTVTLPPSGKTKLQLFIDSYTAPMGPGAASAHPFPVMRGGGRHRVTRRRLTGSKRRKTYVRRAKNGRNQ